MYDGGKKTSLLANLKSRHSSFLAYCCIPGDQTNTARHWDLSGQSGAGPLQFRATLNAIVSILFFSFHYQTKRQVIPVFHLWNFFIITIYVKYLHSYLIRKEETRSLVVYNEIHRRVFVRAHYTLSQSARVTITSGEFVSCNRGMNTNNSYNSRVQHFKQANALSQS